MGGGLSKSLRMHAGAEGCPCCGVCGDYAAILPAAQAGEEGGRGAGGVLSDVRTVKRHEERVGAGHKQNVKVLHWVKTRKGDRVPAQQSRGCQAGTLAAFAKKMDYNIKSRNDVIWTLKSPHCENQGMAAQNQVAPTTPQRTVPAQTQRLKEWQRMGCIIALPVALLLFAWGLFGVICLSGELSVIWIACLG